MNKTLGNKTLGFESRENGKRNLNSISKFDTIWNLKKPTVKKQMVH